jgi:four helix bundle protein
MQPTENLLVAEHAHQLALCTYRHTTSFPASERFGITSQMRRAAVSIASNIAEGCGRGGNRELVRFLYYASGSVSELASQLRIATDLGFGDSSSAASLRDQTLRLGKMLTRLITYLRSGSVGAQRDTAADKTLPPTPSRRKSTSKPVSQ